MFAFESDERRRSRTEYAAGSIFIGQIHFLSQPYRIGPYATLVRTMDQQRAERNKRRISVVLAMANLFIVKTVVILRASMSESVVIWVISLN